MDLNSKSFFAKTMNLVSLRISKAVKLFHN